MTETKTATGPELVESFMSAKDLRAYMTEMQMASASKAIDAMDKAAAARKELEKRLAAPLEITKEVVEKMIAHLKSSVRSAAQRGETEVMVMRFPHTLCSDHGRAINNNEAGWPETLTGRPRQAFEFWQTHLQPAGYRLKAMIVEWPGGMPGDVGFFLSWDDGMH